MRVRLPWLAILLGCVATDVRAEPRVGVRVVSGTGSAQVRRNRFSAWRKLATDMVPAGQELSCEDVCRVQVDAENVVTLTAGAIVSTGTTFFVPLGAPDKLARASEVELRAGKIEALSTAAVPKA